MRGPNVQTVFLQTKMRDESKDEAAFEEKMGATYRGPLVGMISPLCMY